jgi:L-ascorbate metabolism protein UlaG (beta-lactamase superfamily)
MSLKIHYIGHATFMLEDADARVLIDPFLAPNNPAAQVSAEEVDPTHILLSHGHPDHAADVVEVAKRTGAECVAIVELARWLEHNGVEKTHDPNLGGTVTFDWGSVSLVPAWHTNTTGGGFVVGTAAGLVVRIGGQVVYHLGDTCLFGDMKLIGERHEPTIAIVPIGGHFTMDRRDAAYACGLIDAETVIPCHFDTFPKIETDAEAFKTEVESETPSRVVVLAPGETHDC